MTSPCRFLVAYFLRSALAWFILKLQKIQNLGGPSWNMAHKNSTFQPRLGKTPDVMCTIVFFILPSKSFLDVLGLFLEFIVERLSFLNGQNKKWLQSITHLYGRHLATISIRVGRWGILPSMEQSHGTSTKSDVGKGLHGDGQSSFKFQSEFLKFPTGSMWVVSSPTFTIKNQLNGISPYDPIWNLSWSYGK